MHEFWLPERTLLTLDDDAGNTYAVVAVAAPGATVGITRNGEPLPACRWPGEQMNACVAELLRLSGRPA